MWKISWSVPGSCILKSNIFEHAKIARRSKAGHAETPVILPLLKSWKCYYRYICKNFMLKFQTVYGKSEKNPAGLVFSAAPCIAQSRNDKRAVVVTFHKIWNKINWKNWNSDRTVNFNYIRLTRPAVQYVTNKLIYATTLQTKQNKNRIFGPSLQTTVCIHDYFPTSCSLCSISREFCL